jgi:hypothetical protein
MLYMIIYYYCRQRGASYLRVVGAVKGCLIPGNTPFCSTVPPYCHAHVGLRPIFVVKKC